MTTSSNYRWYILILSAVTMALALAMPTMCLTVLFSEIETDLGLSRTEIGAVWGAAAVPGILMALFGGSIGDRFGPKRVLIAACLLSGAAGGARGFSTGFLTLIASGTLFGLVAILVPTNIMKTSGMWFPREQLGMANGVNSMGMALGFTVSSLISATRLSPWLGGWRYVLMFYGVLAMLLSIPWYFTRLAPLDPAHVRTPALSLRAMLAHVIHIKRMWLLAGALLGVGGAVQAMLGYLPLYLQDIGWAKAQADGAAASFHFASLIFVLPIALGSDRLGTRRTILIAAVAMITTGIGLLSVADGAMVWAAAIMAGMVRDGFMAVFFTMAIETDGIGPMYAGTATGFTIIFGNVGGLIAPPLGNSLSAIAPSLPFAFWAGMAFAGLLCILAIKEAQREPVVLAQPAR